jgi:hypothetical protein
LNVAAEVLARLRADGFTLAAEPDGGTRIAPKSKLTDEARALILEHKSALLDALQEPAFLRRLLSPDSLGRLR